MTGKLDVRRALDCYRGRAGQVRLLDVPPLQYLMIDGRGDPNTSAFTEAIQTLYPVAYTMKFASKRDLGRDYVVPPLEALWWADDMTSFTTARDKASWSWTLMTMVPDWLGDGELTRAVVQVATSKGLARVVDLRLETLTEGRCMQALHVGSFDDEGVVLDRMHGEFVQAHGVRLVGRHHEVYLSDVRRTAPARRRTLLRQPVADEM